MAATSPSRLLKICALSVVVTLCSGSYVITTPRKWISGEDAQVCAFIVNNTSPVHFFTVALKSRRYPEELTGPITLIKIPEGKTELCERLVVDGVSSQELWFEVRGYLGGKEVHHRKPISLVSRVMKTFIQTDKYIYKPGQDVQFRILTVIGPYLNVSTDKYLEVWVETPSGSRVAQWTDVQNPGLVQLSMKLTDEPQEGSYKILVRAHSDEEPVTRTFKVEEYVLPRFDATLTTPNYLLRSHTKFNITVCATYTYGQPVKGNLTLEITKQGRKKSRTTDIIEDKIFGCKDIEILAASPETNVKFLYGKILYVNATVVENGTGEVFNVYKKITIHNTAIIFINVGKEDFLKPYLPFTGQVKVAFPDGSPAGGRRMEVCVQTCCKNISTSPAGILEFIFQNDNGDNVKVVFIHKLGQVINTQLNLAQSIQVFDGPHLAQREDTRHISQ
nr:murinoglobulin-1-like [Procambarus clarkii]